MAESIRGRQRTAGAEGFGQTARQQTVIISRGLRESFEITCAHEQDGPITKVTTSPSTNTRRIFDGKQSQVHKTNTIVDKSRSERWKMTGVVGLSWSHLKKLLLNANDLSDKGISWEGLSSLKSLTVLSLSQNHLTALPSVVGTLTSLCQLHIADNKLTSLPAEIGFLNQLQILKAGNNRISSLPSSIGNCHSLIEIDLSSNLLVELPETLGNLRNLKLLQSDDIHQLTLVTRCTYTTQHILEEPESDIFPLLIMVIL
ncbi:hypothetical protein COCNU_04G013570 [Cocos nucifera]|uniref:Uncharacterized protein n=1 Tax=Cocos nucifera TaxID=13894 RepID=A0A8K0N0Y4_COCNU|nr:hypothetical protein COCNU_04G013570 [Cocos nucifera]